MNARHARYPFLGESRQAVQEAGVDLAAVVAEDDAVVERARERVVGSLTNGEVGERARSDRVELLSYPVARVLVSVVDEHVLVRKYADAEANAAYERFTADETDDSEFKSVGDDASLSRKDLLREFDLTNHVHATQDGYDVDVPTYLLLSSSLRPDKWRLVNRALDDGRVPVSEPELDTLLREAVRDRVAEGLPLNVPDEVADALEGPEAAVRDVLSEMDLTREIDTVVPELFPPCMQHLLDQVQRGEHLPHHSRFAITTFLANIGLTTDEIVDIYKVNPGFGEEMTRYQTDHIRGESSPTEYTAPSCATMKAYGDCTNPDDLCDAINHPLSYYEAKLDDEDDDDLEDWRERENEDAEADADAEA
ncbi:MULTISPECIES: DNA primase regulatory subunit PriL [unclassified Halobacterium]|jgi:DNA primase large subunit|uniref:DNA primase regulatory subunit PriL n=1 Tax=unclassified Halobacterium TaxID=2668073 RepID=UPI001E2F9EB7|nr:MULTISPECIES: DNA primase regulatory subunit PriL [unclassified Halobacterium]MCD2200594.1 DNA primase regulatory subunit PriL [Halobacterium sp. KA-4]MCD2203115.1 DNA primase regulatory subunit PriL [Halobacterium sp. KA-6]